MGEQKTTVVERIAETERSPPTPSPRSPLHTHRTLSLSPPVNTHTPPPATPAPAKPFPVSTNSPANFFGPRAFPNLTDTEKLNFLIKFTDSSCRQMAIQRRLDYSDLHTDILHFLYTKSPPKIAQWLLSGRDHAAPPVPTHGPDESWLQTLPLPPKPQRETHPRRFSIIKSSETLLAKHQAAALGIFGRAYEEGLFGLRRDAAFAVRLYEWAVALQCPMATYRLAYCKENGLGTRRDISKASYYYRLGYKLGYVPALHRYAILLLTGNRYIERDIMNGYYILKQAADRADHTYPVPYYDLGMLYLEGNSLVPADTRHAFRLFLKGAELGCDGCQVRVAEEYEMGGVVAADIGRAFRWYKIAADNGQSVAQYRVAAILRIQARLLFVAGGHGGKAGRGGKAARGAEEATPPIKSLRLLFRSKADIEREAFAMAMKAAAAGNIDAILMVAEALDEGVGVEKDPLLSLWYYRIAATLDPERPPERLESLEDDIRKAAKDMDGVSESRGLFQWLARFIA